MAPASSNPPSHHHPERTLSSFAPTTTHETLTHFLNLSQTNPYLHPDAQLSASGITFSAQTGPSGGLVLHHLTRIAKGLAGENLVALSGEELARFGVGDEDEAAKDGDGEKKGGQKRRRSHEEIAQWADTSTALAGAEQGTEGEGEDWQDPETYAQQQRPMGGEVGARSLAPVVSQNGAPPTITHVEDDVTYTDTNNLPSTEVDKAARKAAKKQMRSGERRDKAMKTATKG